MFISMNLENGNSICFQIRLVTYKPDFGVMIYGPEDSFFIYVKESGDIETADIAGIVKIESCELEDFSFFKSSGKDNEKVITGTDNLGSANLTLEDLYHRIKRTLWKNS